MHYTPKHTDSAKEAQRAAITGPNTRWLLPEQQPPSQLLTPINNSPTATGDPAFTSHQNSGSHEIATPGSRAIGQVIRLLPFSLTWGLLTWGLVWVLELSTPYFLTGFALLTSATYWRMNRDEFYFSRNGLERHKVDSARQIRLKELSDQHELQTRSLDAYLQIALRHYGVSDNEPIEKHPQPPE